MDTPTPSLARDMASCGRLKGLWRTDIVYYTDGPKRHAHGEWEVAFALEGRAIVDVFQISGRAEIGTAERGAGQQCRLCVRIWDPRLKLWRFTLHGPVRGITINMLAFSIGEDIVQERVHARRMERWIFSEITDTRLFGGLSAPITAERAGAWIRGLRPYAQCN